MEHASVHSKLPRVIIYWVNMISCVQHVEHEEEWGTRYNESREDNTRPVVLFCIFMPCLYVIFKVLFGCGLELTINAPMPDFVMFCLYVNFKISLG